MSSTRRALLTGVGTVALAGCISDIGDETPTETDQSTVSFDEAAAADIDATANVALVGPVLTDTLTRAVSLLEDEPEPVVVGGRIRTNGTYHGPRPPLELFDGVELDGRTLAVPAERVPAHEFPHTAEPETPPEDAEVIDLDAHPDRVTAPIVRVIETDGRSRIGGWSAAFQLLEDHAHAGGGFGELVAYVRHEDETYRVQHLGITPTPYPGYGFVVRAEATDEAEVTLTTRDLDEETADALLEAIEAGTVQSPTEDLLDLATAHEFLLSDRGLYEPTIE